MPDEKTFKLLKKYIDLFLKGKSKEDIFTYFLEIKKFALHYVISYELEGEIYLVLDNCIIQAIKHRKSQPHRAVQAEAYLTFCNFVKYWSDRATYLAISPMAIYEHLGRKVPPTLSEVHNTLIELNSILSSAGLEIRYINFHDAKSLYPILLNIVHDERILTEYIKDIDKVSWKTDLAAPRGVKIPISIAAKSLPTLPPLKYFDPWYVHLVLSGRVEQYIINQSKHNPNAMPISSGELSILFSKLNKFRKKNTLQGLGDIDIFQICDVCSQYERKATHFFIGQSLDETLSKVLFRRHTLHVSSEIVVGGAPDQKEKISNLVQFMFSKPFEENEIRRQKIQPKFINFMEFITQICLENID